MICPCYESSIPGPNWALILIANPHNVIPGWCELSQKYHDLLCHEIRMETIIKGCLKSNPGALGARSSRDHQFKRCGSSEFFYNFHSQIPQIIIMPPKTNHAVFRAKAWVRDIRLFFTATPFFFATATATCKKINLFPKSDLCVARQVPGLPLQQLQQRQARV